MAREAVVQILMYQNVTINLDTFESEFGCKPTKANVIDVAIGHRGDTDARKECIWVGGNIVLETEYHVEHTAEPEVKKVRRGAGSY